MTLEELALKFGIVRLVSDSTIGTVRETDKSLIRRVYLHFLKPGVHTPIIDCVFVFNAPVNYIKCEIIIDEDPKV